MIKRHPILSTLRIDYDSNKIMDEMRANLHRFLKAGANYWLVAKPPEHFDIIEREHLDRVYYNVLNKDGSFTHRRIVEDDRVVNTWEVINLMELPGMEESSHLGSNKDRLDHLGKWIWRTDLEFPYLTSVITSLPWERIDIVRVLAIKGPGCGPAHRDINQYDHESFYNGHHSMVNINLQPSTVGVPLKVLHNDVVHDIHDKAFAFNDTVWHGVPYFSSDDLRVTVKLIGRMNYQDLYTMIDHDGTVVLD